MSKRGVAWLILGLSGWLVAGVLFVLSTDGREDIDLVGYASTMGASMPEAHEATEKLCAELPGCVQAVDSETLTMRKFDSQEYASAAAATLGGDVRLAGWIVVNFKADKLSESERSAFAAVLYCTHVGPDPC